VVISGQEVSGILLRAQANGAGAGVLPLLQPQEQARAQANLRVSKQQACSLPVCTVGMPLYYRKITLTRGLCTCCCTCCFVLLAFTGSLRLIGDPLSTVRQALMEAISDGHW